MTTEPHVHSDACWEPDSGCDMGRNEKFVVRAEDQFCICQKSGLWRAPDGAFRCAGCGKELHPDNYIEDEDPVCNRIRRWLYARYVFLFVSKGPFRTRRIVRG